MQTRLAHEANRRGEHQVTALAWPLPIKLNGAPLTSDASIRDFQGGMARYAANAVEQTLLLPKDIANLRSMRKHEVFLDLKRDLNMVSLLLFIYYYIIIIIILLLLFNFFSFPDHSSSF